MKLAWLIVGLLLSTSHPSMCQSVAPPPSSASTPTAITGSANTNPSVSASSPVVTPTTKPAITEPAQPSPLPPQGPPILCSDQTVYALFPLFLFRTSPHSHNVFLGLNSVWKIKTTTLKHANQKVKSKKQGTLRHRYRDLNLTFFLWFLPSSRICMSLQGKGTVKNSGHSQKGLFVYSFLSKPHLVAFKQAILFW